MSARKFHTVILLVAVIFLMVAPMVLAQTDEPVLPSDLGKLATPAGLGALITVILGLLKRLNSKSHGWIGGLGDWLNADPFNQFLSSVLLALLVMGGLWAIDYFGVWEVAGEVWATFVVAWTMSQGIYNSQKVVVNKVKP